MSTENSTPSGNNSVRLAIIGVLVVGAFFGAYRIASAVSGGKKAAPLTTGGLQTAGNPAAGAPAAGAPAADAPADSCCGGGQPPVGGVTGAEVEGQAAIAGSVQTIAVDLSTGTYSPNAIKLKAGVPAEITFGQSAGCTGIVQSDDLGFSEDLSGGPKTVKLGALEPGTYAFSCGMSMVYGKIVVE